MYPKECDSGYSRGTCTPMFIAALFTIAKLWKQSRCPTTNGWIKKMWFLYTMEFYSATKKNEILPLPVNGWNWRKSSSVKLARLRRPKITCSPSYADFRPKTNAVILLDMGHTPRGECVQED
jgi:hypothetical protein